MVKTEQEGTSDGHTVKETTVKTDPDSKDEKKSTFFTVKLRGLPLKAKKKDVKEFFKPLKPKSIRVPRNIQTIAYAGFGSEKEYKQALIKNRSFMSTLIFYFFFKGKLECWTG